MRELEAKVRRYQSIERRFNAGIFILGFGVGSTATLLIVLAVLLFRH